MEYHSLEAIRFELRKQTADVLTSHLEIHVRSRDLRLPAKGAAAALYRNGTTCPPPPAQCFGTAFDVPLIQRLRQTDTHLLVDYTDAFYDALLQQILALLPAPREDFGLYALNRALMLSGNPVTTCPADPILQRALLCALHLGNGIGQAQVEQDILNLMDHYPVRERALHTCKSSGVYAAIARCLYQFIKQKGRIE